MYFARLTRFSESIVRVYVIRLHVCNKNAVLFWIFLFALRQRVHISIRFKRLLFLFFIFVSISLKVVVIIGFHGYTERAHFIEAQMQKRDIYYDCCFFFSLNCAAHKCSLFHRCLVHITNYIRLRFRILCTRQLISNDVLNRTGCFTSCLSVNLCDFF